MSKINFNIISCAIKDVKELYSSYITSGNIKQEIYSGNR